MRSWIDSEKKIFTKKNCLDVLSCTTTKIVTSNDRNVITSKKPGTVLLMQNVNLGHTKVIEGDTKPPGGDNP